MNSKTTIIIADDHPLFLSGLRQIIQTRENLRIIGEASNGASALRLIGEKKPDIAILDLDMPKMNGLEVVKKINTKKLFVKVIILTMYSQPDIFSKAMDLGIMGYVLKASAVSDIISCIKTVNSGKRFISPEISEYVLQRGNQFDKGIKTKLGLTELSPTQRKILSLIAANKTTAEIAKELFISPKTVENHRSHICAKLGLHGQNALLRFVIENKSLIV